MKLNFLKFSALLVVIFFVSFTVSGQTITGIVTDEDGENLPGVSVVLKGTTSGVTTDVNGKYSINVIGNESILIYSFVGYKPVEEPVGNRSVIDISMGADDQLLDEVIVVGYGTQKKKDLTGSVASANLEAFKEAPNTSVLQSLQGSLPGVQIGQTTTAGAEPSISVRGQNTLSGNTNPLIIVDGIMYRGRITDLNPSDIKSIDVLKDPSSKAIYGAQAANGVVLITTIKGKSAKKPTVSYSTFYSTQSPSQDARLLNREEILQKVRDVEYRNAYLAPDFTQPNPDWDFSNSELLPLLRNGIDNNTNFDWWGESTSPGYIANHVLNFGGGSESTTYFISGGRTDQRGFIQGDRFARTTARMNIQTDITNWLSIGVNSFGSFSDFSGVSPDMNTLARTSPLVNSRDENGDFIINHLGDNILNPFLTSAADDRDLANNISANAFLVIKVPQIEGLSYRLNYGNNYRWSKQSNSNIYGAGLSGSAFKNNSSVSDVMLDNILTFDRRFNTNHNINITAVAGFNTIDAESVSARGENFSNLGLSYNSLEQAVLQFVSSSAYSEANVYQMGRVNYGFKDRYLLTATLRRDGYSGFAKNNKFGLFPSLGLGWVISEESFMKSSYVDYLKFRASYGQNGNQTGRYSSLARLSAGESSRYVFGDGGQTSIGQSVASLSNNDLTWETTTGINLGIDFNILKKLSGSLDYYNTQTTDLLYSLRLPQLTGFSGITTNIGEIRNNGFEAILNYKALQKESFSWDITANFSANNNRIESLLGIDADNDGVEDDLVASNLFIGRSIGTIFDYQVDGIYQIGDDIPQGYFPGTYRIVDQNGDGVITPLDDRTVLGRAEPAYRFGIQNTVAYKGFTLRLFINSVQGGKNAYLQANHPFGVAGTTGTAQNQNWYNNFDYWSSVNPTGKYPQPWQIAQIRPVAYFSRNFIRLQDISLAYNFSPELTKKAGMQNLKLFVSGKNLLTFTNWDGWDPETGQGIGNNQGFPVMRGYTLGLDVSF